MKNLWEGSGGPDKLADKLADCFGDPATDHGAGHAAALSQALARLTGDLVLVLDETGRVLAAARGEAAQAEVDGVDGVDGVGAWVGRPWLDAAAPDSQEKARRLLEEALSQGQARRREINLVAPGLPALAVRCGALRLGPGPGGPLLVIGRDLAEAVALQQRLLAAQRELEGQAWEARSAPRH